MRPTPPDAVALIKRFEGLHRVLRETGLIASYLCPAAVWTQGYGATIDIEGRPVTRETAPITVAKSEALLARDLRRFEDAVGRLVRVPLTDNQYGALVSFTFNLGAGRLRASTLLRKVNAGLFDEAADQFPRWVMAGGQRLAGLVIRREAERAMFLTPDRQPEIPAAPAAPQAAPQHSWLSRFAESFRRAAQPAQ